LIGSKQEGYTSYDGGVAFLHTKWYSRTRHICKENHQI